MEMLVHAVSKHLDDLPLDLVKKRICETMMAKIKHLPGCGVYALLLPLVAWDCI